MANKPGINLLPDEGQESQRGREHRQQLLLVSGAIVALVAVLIGGAFGVKLLLGAAEASNQSSIQTHTKELSDLKSVESLDRSLNTKLNSLQSILSSYPHFSVLLNNVASLTPSGIRLTNLALDNAGKLSITGIASSASSFGEFVNILKDPTQGGTKFSGVEIGSLSGGGKQNQYNFTVTMIPKGAF